MIKRVEVSGVHYNVGKELQKYVTKKIGGLDKYVPRNMRESVHAEVRLKEAKTQKKKECTCEVVLYLPNEALNATESTLNMFAAVDIVEQKLKLQLGKYKDVHTAPKRGVKLRSPKALFSKIRSRRKLS